MLIAYVTYILYIKFIYKIISKQVFDQCFPCFSSDTSLLNNS